MWSTALIGAAAALTGLFVAWPIFGEAVLPLSGTVLYLRLIAALLCSASLVVWDVRRRHALAKIAELHGIRVAEVPSRLTGAASALLLIFVVGTFLPFVEQRIAFEALVQRNPAGRRAGVLEFFEEFPETNRMDEALDVVLAEPEYLDPAFEAYALIAPALRGRAATRIIRRVIAEPPEAAGRGLAEVARKCEGAETLARRDYVDGVIPRLLANGDLPPGARAMVQALAEPTATPRVGLAVEPARPPPSIEMLAGRLARTLEDRAPFPVVRTGGEYLPRRIELRWSVDGSRTAARLRLFAPSSPSAPVFQREYELADGDPHAQEKFGDAVIHDVLPPP
jgi:hypothetical protein